MIAECGASSLYFVHQLYEILHCLSHEAFQIESPNEEEEEAVENFQMLVTKFPVFFSVICLLTTLPLLQWSLLHLILHQPEPLD